MSCEHCSAPLRAPEVIVCDGCAIAQLEALLASEVWRAVRGPRVVAEIERDLAQLRARQPS